MIESNMKNLWQNLTNFLPQNDKIDRTRNFYLKKPAVGGIVLTLPWHLWAYCLQISYKMESTSMKVVIIFVILWRLAFAIVMVEDTIPYQKCWR